MLWVIKSTATGTFQQFPTPTAHKRLHPRKPLTPTQERDHHPRFHPTFLKGCMKHEKKKSSFRIFFFFFLQVRFHLHMLGRDPKCSGEMQTDNGHTPEF